MATESTANEFVLSRCLLFIRFTNPPPHSHIKDALLMPTYLPCLPVIYQVSLGLNPANIASLIPGLHRNVITSPAPSTIARS